MNIALQAGTYVIAVSGGVDSVVLLDMLAKRPELNLIVAHFDHGIRAESGADYTFVESLAGQYGLEFEGARGSLGPQASEAAARKARYAFLEEIVRKHEAQAIVTAHHQDDVLETMILNMLRGTDRRGLSSLRSTKQMLRPFLPYAKAQLVEYAHIYKLTWHDDATNASDVYLRNYIRHHLLPRFDVDARNMLWDIYISMESRNAEIDTSIAEVLDLLQRPEGLDRYAFSLLPHVVAREVLAAWLRQFGYMQYDRRMLERLVISAKVLAPGQQADVYGGMSLRIFQEYIALSVADR